MQKRGHYKTGDERDQVLRMTDADVAELRLRQADGEVTADLVREFTDRCGVSRAYVYMLLKGERRRDDAAPIQGDK